VTSYPADVPSNRTGRRVLVIVQNLPFPRDRSVWLQCRTLVDAGHRVSVISPRGESADVVRHHEDIEGIEVHRYDAWPAGRGVLATLCRDALCWLRSARVSLAVARRHGFDIVQVSNSPDTYWLLGLLWRLRGKRFVFDQHDLHPETYEARTGKRGMIHRLLTLMERLTYRVADAVIVRNESFKAVALQRGRVPADRVTVVRTGPDAATMRRGPADPALRRGGEHLVVYLGVIEHGDGVDLAVRAADHIVHALGCDDVRFAFLGSGDELEPLRRLVAQLGLEHHVEMPGYLPDELAFSYLSTADVALSPAPLNPLNDVLSTNKTMKYMAFGLPIVAFDLKETRVTAEDAAVYATPNDVIELASLVVELLGDRDRRDEMGRAGRERIESALAWQHQAGDYLGVYERVAG
jgi:glycosyltransferase involved in cell wall biosynthesis